MALWGCKVSKSMSQTSSKARLLQTQETLLSNGINLSVSDSEGLNCITILGGIDEILGEYLRNNTIILDQSQLKDIHQLFKKLSSINDDSNSENHNDLADNST